MEAQRVSSGKHSLWVIFASRTVLNSTYRIVYPFLPSIARGLGIPLTAASGIVSLRMTAGLAAPFLGPISDRYGRRRCMILGLLLTGAASLLLAALGTLPAAIVAFVAYGLAKVIYDPAVHAYVGDTTPYAQRARAIGIVELSWSAAWLLGVPASGALIERLGWRAPWAFLVVLSLAGAWLTHKKLPRVETSCRDVSTRGGTEPTQRPLASLVANWSSLLRRRAIVALLFTSALLTFAIEIPFIVYGAWLEGAFGLSLTTIGVASIAVGLAETTAEFGTTFLTDRLGKRRSILLGLVGLAVSLTLLPYLAKAGLVSALAGVMAMMLTFEFAIVSLLPLVTELAPEARATLLSLNLLTMSLGRMVGSVTGGWLWKWESIAIHTTVGAACALLAALILAWGVAEIQA
jgi:predicted MFS family arabinose efflux permease